MASNNLTAVPGTASGGVSEQRKISVSEAAMYRPAYHYTPPRDWLSDPNGMVYAAGVFHLCYQHDRYDAIFENMSWGHAVSHDLLHWQEMSPVVTPDTELGMCFSGCMVVDAKNSAGFGKDALIGFYTSELPKQQQSMIVSVDGGVTFEKYAHNPVIASSETTPPDFRDPKVFWCAPADCWMMSVAGPERIEFWSSHNLTDWQFESQFGADHGVHGVQWECPDLRRMPIDGNPLETCWVLIVSVNPGAPNGGSGTMYFVGDFSAVDGQWQFISNHTEPRWLDWGCDNYAHVGWAGLEDSDFGERVLSIGWMNNWNYATTLPTAPWRGCMTLIRELAVQTFGADLCLTARPAPFYAELMGATLAGSEGALKEPVLNRRMDIGAGLATSLIDIHLAELDAKEVGVELSNDDGDLVRIGYLPGTGFFVDRTAAGECFHEQFAGHHIAATAQLYRQIQIEIYLDRCSVEVFFNGGEYSMTELIFPTAPLTHVKPYARGQSELVSAAITEIGAIRITGQ